MCDCDQYVEHLSHISVNQQLVLAADDVTNQFGVMLLRRGTPLGTYALDKMRGHRLNKPVDEALEMRRRLTPEDLVGCFVDMIEAEADLRQINETFRFEDRVRHLCHTLDWPAPMLQKLSAMQSALPKVFHRALFTAWLGALIASERKLDAEDVGVVFQAGLYHDIGLLHIPPALVDKKADIAPEEWLLIQRHVITGAQIVEQSTRASARLIRVILEHHERHDGAGYPAGKLGADLDRASSILALADMLHALRFQKLLLSAGSLADCMPFLRVNRRTFAAENYSPAGRILLSARNAPRSPASEQKRPSFQAVIDANRSLINLLASFATAPALIDSLPDSRSGRSILQLIEQVQLVTLSSGLGNEALDQGLQESLAIGRHDPGVEDIMATAQEVFWLVRRIDRQLKELLATLRSGEGAIAVKDLSMRVSAELTRAWRRFET